MGVITDAIIQKMLNDPILAGTKDGNGNWLFNGLVTPLSVNVWDPAQGKQVSKNIPGIISWEQQLPVPSPGVKGQPPSAFIVTFGNTTDVPSLRASSKQRRARDITRDIFCLYAQDTKDQTDDFDSSYVEKMADRVHKLFDRQPLVIPDPSDPTNYDKWETVMVRANGPIAPPFEQRGRFQAQFKVLVVTISFTIQVKP